MPDSARHWHVTLTLAGAACEPMLLRAALLRLSHERPFMDSIGLSRETVEIQFWDQGDSMLDVASLALRLWDEHRDSAGLPHWQVVGLEVVEQQVHEARRGGGAGAPSRPTLTPLAF